MWSGGLSLSGCRAGVLALLWPLCCSGGAHKWLWPMARKGRGWDMRWCEHHFINYLVLAWTQGSESGTGLPTSLVQSWCVWCLKVKVFAARLTDLSYQTGFEKHSIFKLKAELRPLQPLCLWVGVPLEWEVARSTGGLSFWTYLRITCGKTWKSGNVLTNDVGKFAGNMLYVCAQSKAMGMSPWPGSGHH